MGLLRVILALAVVVEHTRYPVGMAAGRAAVQVFYMISGFYMGLILNDKYVGEGSLKKFYANRALRIYPMYWIALLATAAASLATWAFLGDPLALGDWIAWGPSMKPSTTAFAAFDNLTIISNLSMFLEVDSYTGGLALTSDFNAVPKPFWKLLLIPPAWSLGVELGFYLVAPFLVRRKVFVIGTVCVLSVAVRLLLAKQGLTQDPWTYRFLPSEMVFFCSGALGYRFYRRYLKGELRYERLCWVAVIAAVVATLFYTSIPFVKIKGEQRLYYYVLLAAALPFIFRITRKIRLDTWIGELSYPIYISHYTVVSFFDRYEGWTGLRALLAVVLSVACSLVLRRLALPFEVMRSRNLDGVKNLPRKAADGAQPAV